MPGRQKRVILAIPGSSRTVCLALATAQSPAMWHNLQAIRMTELHIFYLFSTKKLELLECGWWALDMHVILKLARLRQRNYHKFKVRLGYIVSSELVYMTE